MKIDRVTISGADNLVSIDEMLYTQEVFPFVEWGVLISTKRMGTNRYPTLDWIRKLDKSLNISFHLCGDIVRDFVAGGLQWFNMAEENDLHYDRLQLNFSFKEDKDYLDNLMGLAKTALKMNRDNRRMILAYNKGSKKNLDSFISGIPSAPDNINYLYDSSGGRGTEIKSFNKPLKNYTGYAGGISPDNADIVCSVISNMEWSDNVWIDMESGIRSEDKFDIQKVNKVLSICKSYITPLQ